MQKASIVCWRLLRENLYQIFNILTSTINTLKYPLTTLHIKCINCYELKILVLTVYQIKSLVMTDFDS